MQGSCAAGASGQINFSVYSLTSSGASALPSFNSSAFSLEIPANSSDETSAKIFTPGGVDGDWVFLDSFGSEGSAALPWVRGWREHSVQVRSRPLPSSGVPPFHQTSTFLTQLTLGPCVVQISPMACGFGAGTGTPSLP